MSTFIHSAFRGMLKGLLRLLGGFLLLAALVVFVVWSQGRQTSQEKWKADAAAARTAPLPDAPSQWATPPISQKELQILIADVYHVETSRFIQPDLMWITLPPGADVQKTCQAIANVWAHRSKLDYVRVESWIGNTRLGQGTVHYGRMITP